MFKKYLIFLCLLFSMNSYAEVNGQAAGMYTFRGSDNYNSSNVYRGNGYSNSQQTTTTNRTNQNQQKYTYIAPNSNKNFWQQPRRLHLIRLSTGEEVNVVYWANGKVIPEGYQQLNWIMRDVQAKKVTNMDIGLYNLLFAIQSWVSYYGYHSAFIINSGYRSPATNKKTEGAAKNSMHMQGKATDFSIPGLPWQYVGQLASRYQAGGVGFYPGHNFIHIDTGRVRYWVH